MKNTKIKLLTATACLALVGTASAAWVYSGTATESANLGVKVASYASAGSITVTASDKINVLLDNGSVKFVRDSDADTISAKHNVPSEFSSESKTVSKIYMVVISPKLATYVNFDSSYDTTKITVPTEDTSFGGTTIAKGSICLSDGDDENFQWTDGVDIFSKLPSLAYASSMSPSSQADYWNMINYFKADTITSDNWDDVQNTEWNVTSDLNSDVYVQIVFAAIVEE